MSDFCLPGISAEDGDAIWNKRRQDSPILQAGSYEVTFTPEFIASNPDQKQFSIIQLDKLMQDLNAIREKYSSDDGSCRKRSSSEIDASVAEVVHSNFSKLQLSPYQLSDVRFWTWLSNLAAEGFFWKFIFWRFKNQDIQAEGGGDQSKKAAPDPARVNWGICSPAQLHEIYFAGAWLRSHKAYDSKKADPYAFVKMGGIENWRSHILRVEFGWDREFVKALVEVIKEDKMGASSVRKILVPSLRAWMSSANFANLSYDDSKTIIRHLFKAWQLE